jgi:hypothetical protein
MVYNDAWAHDLVSQRQKLDWLAQGAEDGRREGGVAVVRGALDDFRPLPFMNGELISLPDCFDFRLSGLQTKRDQFVYGFSEDELSERI